VFLINCCSKVEPPRAFPFPNFSFTKEYPALNNPLTEYPLDVKYSLSSTDVKIST